MVDTVALEAADGQTLDDLGTATTTWRPVYTGPGLMQALATQPAQVDATGRPVVVQAYACKLPAAVLVPDGHTRVRVLASLDAANIGTYQVLADQTQGLATARRLICTRST